MLYREAGQFKTSYIADSQIFPIRQDRIGFAVLMRGGLRRRAASPPRTTGCSAILIPFLIFVARGAGAEHPDRLLPASSRWAPAAFMARGRLRGLQLPGARSRACRCWLAFILAGLSAALVGVAFGLPSLRIKGFYLAVATLAAQFFVRLGADQVPLVVQQQLVRRDHGASGCDLFGFAIDTPVRQVPVRARLRDGAGLRRQEPGALGHRPRLDGRARHGRGRRGHRHSADAHQAARLRGQLVLLRRGRRALCVLLPRLGGAGRLLAGPLVPHPVHDHHRRGGQHPRLLPRRRVHPAAADFPRQRAARRWPRCCTCRSRMPRCRTSS